MHLRSLFFTFVLLLGLPSHAQETTKPHNYDVQKPRPVAADPRFKTYIYRPNGVYSYIGYFGYQSRIEFEVGAYCSTCEFLGAP